MAKIKRIRTQAILIVTVGYINTNKTPTNEEILLAVENQINDFQRCTIFTYGPGSGITAGIRIHITPPNIQYIEPKGAKE